MEPIISPSIFYWFEVLGNVRTCSGVFFGIGIFALLVFLIFFFVVLAENDDFKDDLGKTIKKACIITVILTAISGLFRLFIPSQETLIAMTAARYVTPDNIAAVGGTVEDSIEFITNEIIRVVEASDNKDDTNS